MARQQVSEMKWAATTNNYFMQVITEHYPKILENIDTGFHSLIANAEHTQIPTGTLIFDANRQCNNLMFLITGCVRVFEKSEDGRELTFYRVLPGDMCVLSLSTLLGGNAYPAKAIVEQNVTGFSITAETFKIGLRDSVAFREFVTRLLSEHLHTVMELVSEISFRQLDMRLACLLGRRFEMVNSAPIHVTHAELASDLGTTRVVISRILKEFENQNCIKLLRGRIQLVEPNNLWSQRK